MQLTLFFAWLRSSLQTSAAQSQQASLVTRIRVVHISATEFKLVTFILRSVFL